VQFLRLHGSGLIHVVFACSRRWRLARKSATTSAFLRGDFLSCATFTGTRCLSHVRFAAWIHLLACCNPQLSNIQLGPNQTSIINFQLSPNKIQESQWAIQPLHMFPSMRQMCTICQLSAGRLAYHCMKLWVCSASKKPK
jgi:hypothetical protein